MSVLDKLYNLVKTLNMNDENEEKCYGVSTDFVRKLTDLFFINIDEEAPTNIPLSKMYRLIKIATLTCLYGTMHLELYDYSPYSYKKYVIFETHINRNLRCIHGYTNCVAHNDLITWVSKNSWDMLLYKFSQAGKIIPCPRTIIFNNCEQNNLVGDIFNAGDNVDDHEDYGFIGSFIKISPTVIDYYKKQKFLNMQLEHFRPQRNIENNDKQYDEIYQINLIDDKESDERYQIV